jgi:hypothetical protein
MEERGRSRIKYTKEAGDDSEVKQLRGNLEKFRSVHTREAKDNSIVERARKREFRGIRKLVAEKTSHILLFSEIMRVFGQN